MSTELKYAVEAGELRAHVQITLKFLRELEAKWATFADTRQSNHMVTVEMVYRDLLRVEIERLETAVKGK